MSYYKNPVRTRSGFRVATSRGSPPVGQNHPRKITATGGFITSTTQDHQRPPRRCRPLPEHRAGRNELSKGPRANPQWLPCRYIAFVASSRPKPSWKAHNRASITWVIFAGWRRQTRCSDTEATAGKHGVLIITHWALPEVLEAGGITSGASGGPVCCL